jgi:hypothetical protein
MENDTRISVDVAKAVLDVAVSARPGHVLRHQRSSRDQFLPSLAQQPRAVW